MGSTALKGTVQLSYIKLGAYRFFVAPYGTGIDETVPFNTENIPNPWVDLGLAGYDSGLNYTAGFFDLKSGIPSNRKKKYVIEREASMSLTLEEYSPPNLGRAIWNNMAGKKTFMTAPAQQQLTANPAATATSVSVTNGTQWTAGQWIALEVVQGDLPLSQNEYLITSIAGNTLNLNRKIGVTFASTPWAGQVFSWKIPFGAGKTSKVALIGVYDDLDRGQLLFMMPQATIRGDFNLTIQAGTENLKFPMTCDADDYTLNLLKDGASLQSIAGAPTPTPTVFTVSDGTQYAPGDQIAVEATTDLLDNSENVRVIQSIAVNAITLTRPLPTAPAAGYKVQTVTDSFGSLVSILRFSNAF